MKKRILSLVLAVLMIVSILPAPTHAADVEGSSEAEPFKPREAKIISIFPVLWKDPTNNDPAFQVSPLGGELPAVVMVVDVHHYSDTLTLYKLDAVDGETWPEQYSEHRWMESSKLSISCEKCGNYDCTVEHVWCDDCGKYDCGIDHGTTPSAPTDPSVPEICEICGEADCIRVHFWCDLCQKYDCGLSHPFCPICGKLECGVTHVYCRFCNAYDCSQDHEDPFKPLTTPAIPANPTLPEGEGVFVLDSNGNVVPATGLTLSPGMKTSISAWPSGDAENVTYKWQICYNNTNSLWVDIHGQTGKGILVSASMVRGVVDYSGLTYLRCVAYDGSETRTSDPIPVRLVQEQAASQLAASGSVRNVAAPSGDNEIQTANEVTYAVTVRYEVKHTGVEAPQPKVFNLKAGDNYILDVTHPTMPGYYPGDAAGESVPQTTMTIVDIQAPVDIVIYYWPDYVDFVVNHYEQNVGDDNYTLRDTQTYSDKKTGEAVGTDLGMNYEGFDRLPYDTAITVAADGSTVVNIYYDRQYFMLSLDLNGGYGAEPIYARYGTPVSIPNPKCTGYTFAGWSPAIPSEVRGKTEHTAQWKNAATTFTVAFWYENANDADYTFVGSMQQSGITDDTVNGSDYAKLNDLSNALHFDGFEADYAKHFTSLNTSKTDKNVKIKADGTTVVNVYFYRNTYQLTYYEFVCQHQTHSSSCYTTTLTCGKVQHTHSHEECCSNQSGIFHFTHRYSACPYKSQGGEHTHSASCYTSTLTCDHATSKSYFNCACITNDAHNNIQKNFANWKILYQGKHKFEENVGHIHQQLEGTEGYRWIDHMLGGQMKEPYGDGGALGSFTAMPGGETIFCRGGNGASPFRMIYWLETTDGNGPRTFNGKNFARGATFFNKMSFVAWSGDYVEGTPRGFEPFDATFGDADNSSSKTDTFTETLSTSENKRSYKEWNNFYYIRKTYDLEYFNGETRVATRSMKFEESLTPAYNLQNLTMTSPYGPGYQFGGWYLDPECTIPVKFDGSERMPDGGMAVYAKWSPVTHTVKTYKDKENVGGTPINTYGIPHGEMYDGTVPIPQGEAGMNFVGWFYEEDGKENAYDFSMPVYRDMNLYAKWNSGTMVTGKIYYVDENGNELARHSDITGLVGDTKTYSAKLSSELGDGNTLYLPNVTSHNIKFSGNASQNTFTFVYKAMPEVGYTIKFVNKDNPSHQLFDPITGKSNSPTVFYDAMANNKTVEKYYVDKNSKTFVLSSDEELNEFYFYYTYDPGKATVQVQHYIENADGTGYDFHSETPSTVEELGTLIKAADRKVTINGFTYGYAEFNGVKAEQATLSGGLTVKLYYTRNSYRYTFRFVYKDSQGNEVEFPNSAVTGTAKYNTSVSQDAKTFPGYTPASRTQTLVVFYQESNNVRTFVYEEQDVTIRYQVGAVKGGTVSAASETIKAVTGTAAGAVAAVSNANYRFVGWFDNYRGNGEPVSTSLSFVPAKNSDNVYEAKTYYALFEEIKVDIRYQVQMPAGAAVTATLTKNSEQVNVVTGIATGTDVAAIPAGYEFEGWYDANGNKVGSAESLKPTRPADQWVDETTFTAKFVEKKATVNYVAVGPGTVSVFSEKVNMVTGNATGAAAVPTEHYGNFVGWYRDEACTDLVTNGTSFVPGRPSDGWAESQTYYAKFENVEYTITYVDRDNTYTQTYVKGDKLQPPTWSVQNYALAWTLKSTDGNWDGAALDGLIYRNNPIEFYGNVTLEAVWTTTVAWVDWDWELVGESSTTARLDVDNGVLLGQEFVYDGPALFREATAEYTYTFEGQWERLYIAEIANEPIIVFRAVYTETKNQYTVTFVLDNGQPNVVQTNVWGTEVIVPTNFTKEGYTFTGWDKTVPTAIPTENVTVTAQWEINKYTVKFVDDDDTLLQSTVLNHGDMPTPPANPTKADDDAYSYAFKSWDKEIVAATGDATYKATYTATEKTCTITYVAGEGGTVKLIGTENWLTQTAETVLVKTGNPVGAAVLPNTGYKFIGWYAGDKLVSKNANLVPDKTGDLYVAATYTARFELALVELTIEVADPQGDESYIFTVTGSPSDGSVFNPMQVVLTKANNYKVTIKDIPVGIYTVHEENGWSWRQEMVEDQIVLLGESRTATFKFKVVERIYWLSGESYNKRKKGGSSNG